MSLRECVMTRNPEPDNYQTRLLAGGYQGSMPETCFDLSPLAGRLGALRASANHQPRVGRS